MIDFTTHRRNSKGEIVSVNPYSCHIINGVKVFKQPGSFDGYELENGDACTSEGTLLPKTAKAVEPVKPPAQVTKPAFEKAQ